MKTAKASVVVLPAMFKKQISPLSNKISIEYRAFTQKELALCKLLLDLKERFLNWKGKEKGTINGQRRTVRACFYAYVESTFGISYRVAQQYIRVAKSPVLKRMGHLNVSRLIELSMLKDDVIKTVVKDKGSDLGKMEHAKLREVIREYKLGKHNSKNIKPHLTIVPPVPTTAILPASSPEALDHIVLNFKRSLTVVKNAFHEKPLPQDLVEALAEASAWFEERKHESSLNSETKEAA